MKSAQEPGARRPRAVTRAANRYGPFAVIAALLAVVIGLAPTKAAPSSGPRIAIPSGSSAGVSEACAHGLKMSEIATCRPQWSQGSNGGDTWPGVTGKSVNVVAYGSSDYSLIAGMLGGEGPGKLIGTPAEEAHTMQVYTQWFNKNFQTYGRKVNIIPYNSGGTLSNASSTARSDAVAIQKQDHAFAVIGGALDEGFFSQLAREKIVSIVGVQFPESFYKQNAPYLFGMLPTTDDQNSFIAAFVCHQLGAHSVAFFGGADSNPPVNGRPRKFGIVYPTTNADGSPSIYTTTATNMAQQLSKCGIHVNKQDQVGYALDPTTAISQIQADSARLRQDRITTVICLCDPISPTLSAGQMAGQHYYPEQVETGYLLQDYYQLDQLYNQDAWSHVFGISSLPVSTSPKDGLYWQAYHQIDPSTDPNPDAQLLFYELLLVFAGIQGAGPTLTPETFAQAMFQKVRIDSTSPTLPTFHYSASDYGGIKDAQIVWWDPTAPSPDGKPGDFQSVDGGYRFTPADWPDVPGSMLFHNTACTLPGSCGLPSYPSAAAPGVPAPGPAPGGASPSATGPPGSG